MVYRGKPSEGCGACRARKVKCDQTKPACNRCSKANRTCPGYRDQLSLWFRDESQSVAQKVQTSSTNSATPRSSSKTSVPGTTVWRTGSADSDRSEQISLEFHLPIFTFLTDPRFQAACLFFSSYAWLNAGVVNGHLDHDLPSTASLGEKALMAGLTAVGLANLSSLRSSRKMRVAARHEYANALKWMNAALSDPIQATEDSTLTGIICLSLFEIITCKKPESIDAWVQHTRGATALLELRGKHQLTREKGLQLFYALRNETIVGCLQRRQPLPPSLIKLSEQAAIMSTASPAVSVELMKAIARLCDIRVDHCSDVGAHDPEILSCALALDSDLAVLLESFSQAFSYSTITCDPSLPLSVNEYYQLYPYCGVIHLYNSTFACNNWNNYRYTRILTHDIILGELRKLVHESGDTSATRDIWHEFSRSRDLMRQLASDICATVPFQFGLVNPKNKDGIDPTSIKSPIGGFSLLFPLYVAASVDGAGSPTFDWAISTLTIIARAMGIDQALALVEMLQSERCMTRWDDISDDGNHWLQSDSMVSDIRRGMTV